MLRNYIKPFKDFLVFKKLIMKIGFLAQQLKVFIVTLQRLHMNKFQQNVYSVSFF